MSTFAEQEAAPCVPVIVSKLLWTSQKRCSYILNSRNWRCKQPPTMFIENREAGTGASVCEDHLRVLTAGCPEPAPVPTAEPAL